MSESQATTDAIHRFRQIEGQAERLNAVSNHLAGRARQAKERFQRAEGELEEELRSLARIPTRILGRPKFRRPEPHPELLREVEEARIEHERIARDYEEARVRWAQTAQLMEHCKQALRDRGIVLERTYMGRHSNVPSYAPDPNMLPAAQRII